MADQSFPAQARVVIVGGGIMGVGLAYHLAHEGWSDVVLLEKAELTSGSTWHAAGQITHSTSSFGLGKCVDYNIGLYSGGLEAETGQPVTWHGCGSFRLAYDNDYVYVAISCPSENLFPDSHADSQSSSIRDNDLTQADRMQLSIDIDRDLMTAMQLQVSDARRTHDAIDGHPRWSPSWYVASKRSDERVTFEIAIHRRDLVDLPIHAGKSWYISATPIRAGTSSGTSILPHPEDWMRVIFHN